MSSIKRLLGISGGILGLTSALLLSGCRQDMHDQPKFEAYEAGSQRPAPEGVVARGSLDRTATEAPAPTVNPTPPAGATPSAALPRQTPTAAQLGSDKTTNLFPFAITAEVLNRGQERFNINCAPCHSRIGDGNGMIVQRGFRKPVSFHDERVRTAPNGHFYDVITNGLGAMPSYSDKLSVEDRWKVVAYIRALQLSQRASESDVPPAERAKLAAGQPTAPSQPGTGGQHQ